MYAWLYPITWKNKPKFKPDPNLKLVDQVRQVLRYNHFTRRDCLFWA